jgi:signal transduction histidine kinase
MKARLRSTLLDPLNIAAYIAWAVIAISLWQSESARTGVLPDAWFLPAALGLHLGFLACFLGCQGREHSASARVPQTLVLAQVAIALALMSLQRYSVTPVLLVIATAQAVAVFTPRQLLLVLGPANLAAYCIARFLWLADQPLLFMLSYLSFQLFAGMMTWYALKSERSSLELAQANADLIATRSLLTETARDSERLRLSRELHDVAGHKLTALKLNLAALARDPALQSVATVPLCAQLADELLADIRGVVEKMRSDEGLDLRRAIEALAAPFPCPVLHLELGPDTRVPDLNQAETVLRTVQEALTNCVRHSSAENLWVVLRRDAGALALDIRDDGRGTGPLRFGNGLAGMRERLRAQGGDLLVEQPGTGGLRLLATLPVSP